MADNTEQISTEEHVTVFDRFLKDGVSNIDSYHRWKKKFIVVVPTNSYVLVRKRFDKNVIRVEERGFIFLNPLFEEYLFAPKNETSIDYEPKKLLTRNGIYLDIDPVVRIRITDPITYYTSSNTALADLKDMIFSILNSYVSRHTMEEITSIHTFPLGELAPSEINDFELKYGIKIEQIRNKPVGIPKEIEEARVKTKKAEQDVKTAQFEKDAAGYRAEAELAFQRSLIKTSEQARDLGLSDELIGKLIDNNSIRNAPEGTNIFMGNTGGYFPAWAMNANNRRVIPDGQQSQNSVTVDEEGNVIEEGQGRVRRR